jgi:hypothetical protein
VVQRISLREAAAECGRSAIGAYIVDYKPEHAARALAIIEQLYSFVSPRPEYRELIAILREPNRWNDAHALFSRIRTNITLPIERRQKQDLDAYFAYVAENAAKTAYNCSGSPAPFDNDSFEWLLKCEHEFNVKRLAREAALNAGPTRRSSGWSWFRRVLSGGR